MSWLLVACAPGLLMLGAIGLERLEAGLTRDRLDPPDIAALLSHPPRAIAGQPASVPAPRRRAS